jgi:hypothetical protein
MNTYQIASLPYVGYPDVPPDAYHGTRALVVKDKGGLRFVVSTKYEDTIADAIREGVLLVGVGIILDCDTRPMDYKDWRFVVAFTDGGGAID